MTTEGSYSILWPIRRNVKAKDVVGERFVSEE
jgi:hypothetical protein